MSLRFEDFELLGKLDDDGLWETWLARGLSREPGAPPLAFMKRIPSGRASMRELILLHRQVGRAASVRHRNIIPILSHGKTGDDYTVLRASFPGQTVGSVAHRHLGQRHGALAVETSVEILLQLAEVLAAIHAVLDDAGQMAPVVHGALGANTVLMDHRGGVRLFDAGLTLLARSAQPEMLRENEWRYVGPEAFRGERDVRSDVYAWGSIAWELLAGQPLYGRVGRSERMRTISAVEPHLASRYNERVSRELEQIVSRAIAKDPGQRFADGTQLAGMLNHHVRPQYAPVDARSLASLVNDLFAEHKPLWSEALRAVVEADADRAVELFRELGRADLTADTPFGAVTRRRDEYTEPISGAGFTVDETIPDRDESAAVQLDAEQLFGDLDFDLAHDDSEDLRETNQTGGVHAPLAMSARPDDTAPIRELEARHLGSFGAFDDEYDPNDEAEVDVDYSLQEIEPAAWDQPELDVAEAPPEAEFRAYEEPRPVSRSPRAQPHADAAPQDFKFKTHAGYAVGEEDDEDDEGEFVEPFPIEQVVTHPSAPDAGGKRRVVEVIKVVGGVVTDNGLLQGLSRTYEDRDLRVAMSWEKSTVTYESQGTTGTIRLIDGQNESIPSAPGRFRLQFGEQATIHKEGATYLIRSFRPPETPAAVRRRDPREVIRPFIGAFGISIVAHIIGFGFVMLTESLGVTLTIERSETVEVFAEGRLERPKPKPPEQEKPEPPPKPKPKPTRPTEQRADPAEQKPMVPKSVRKRLDKRLNAKPEKAEESAADSLVAALTTPVLGDGETVSDTVTNIDAVKTVGQPSALRVAGTIAAIEGNEVNVGRGGGGKLGDLTKGVKGGTGKLEARKTDEAVRGKVNASQALSKVQGSLSKAEVYAVISKHQQAILRCYEKQLARKPGLSGKISFEWTVKTNGSVTKTREQSSTLNDAAVSKCVIDVIKTMKFPKPKGGEVVIVYPFFFQTK